MSLLEEHGISRNASTEHHRQDSMIEVKDLTKWFPVGRGVFPISPKHGASVVHAVDGVTFQIERGEIFALAGETGCGKTTTGMMITRLIEPTSGQVLLEGKDIAHIPARRFKKYRKRMQIIFQDPYESLSPRQKVGDIVAEPLRLLHLVNSRTKEIDRVKSILKLVRLVPPEQFMSRYPHELSGGQRQRVAIARAIVVNPEFIVADEPVSMLDVSIRAGVLEFLSEIRRELGVAILFITHDLAVASYLADRIGIMYLGKIVEMGPAERMISNPLHPYTQALIASVPSPDPTKKRRKTPLKGDPPSPVNPPTGCRFHPRCSYAKEICGSHEPILEEAEKGHMAACFFWKEIQSHGSS